MCGWVNKIKRPHVLYVWINVISTFLTLSILLQSSNPPDSRNVGSFILSVPSQLTDGGHWPYDCYLLWTVAYQVLEGNLFKSIPGAAKHHLLSQHNSTLKNIKIFKICFPLGTPIPPMKIQKYYQYLFLTQNLKTNVRICF